MIFDLTISVMRQIQNEEERIYFTLRKSQADKVPLGKSSSQYHHCVAKLQTDALIVRIRTDTEIIQKFSSHILASTADKLAIFGMQTARAGFLSTLMY